MKNFNGLSEEKVDELILNYLTTNKFQSSLNSLIISTLSQKKNMSLDRDGLSNQIISHQYIKDVENEILQNLFEAFDIENYDTTELINLKYKSIIGNQNKLNSQSILNSNSPLNSVNSTMNNNISNMKLLSTLLEDFISYPFKPDNYLKIESYIGDLSNFDVELLLNCGKIDEILKKVNQFIKLGCSKDLFLNSNLINFFSKLSMGTNTVVLCKSINIFLDYFSGIVGKFYESSFDITKFYKLSYNVECLNKLVMKFYENSDVHLRKIDEKLVKGIVDKIFETIMKNYSPNNPVYISDYSPDDDGGKEGSNEFGLSTNYILLLFFILDRHFSVFKVLFRLSTLRKYILPKFEGNNMIKTLPFLDMVSCIASLNKKFCFLWYHSSVLEKLYSAKKINKKFLLYCWISIKLNFLGLILRYKSLRNKFYETIKEVDSSLNCFLHFRNVLALTVDLVLESNKDFDDYQRDNLFYLTKEILCDFILYCEDKDCCEKKYYLIKEINERESLKKNKMIKYLIEDLKLALNENIYTHGIDEKIQNEENNEIEEDEKLNNNNNSNNSDIKNENNISNNNINSINFNSDKNNQ